MITEQPHPTLGRRAQILARLFDIRIIVAALIGIYGIVLIVGGAAPGVLGIESHTPSDANRVDLEAGTTANLWVGLILAAVAAVFVAWALLRPLPVRDSDASGSDGDEVDAP
ncbi:hypothetical protein ACXVUM_14620 [Williamsia sp. SKLECPSW1]